MNQMKAFAVIALLCAGLTGCTDFSSPQGVVRTAGHALAKNKLRLFKATLTGEARQRFGNAEGMALLQSKFTGLDLGVGETVLVSEQGRKSDYKVEIVGRTAGNPTAIFSKLAETEVLCETRTVYHNVGGHGGPEYDPGFESSSEVTDCRISQLAL